MIKNLSPIDAAPAELRELVKWSVAILGKIIEKEAGSDIYQLVEEMRKNMAQLREGDDQLALNTLEKYFDKLSALDADERLSIARSYTLMLELINACENAYRSHRLNQHAQQTAKAVDESIHKFKGEAIVYVLTSHPTEARSPQSIAVFHSIQHTLQRVFASGLKKEWHEKYLQHELQLAWRVLVSREKSPQVKDEAEHIYSTLFKEETLISLLAVSREVVPVYIRTWVGGDKDGHPGVDEKVMKESLTLARSYLIGFAQKSLVQVRDTLDLLPKHPLHSKLAQFSRELHRLKLIQAGDGARVKHLRSELVKLEQLYQQTIGAVHPLLMRLRQLFHVFPGLVVPLELRESSDMLMGSPKFGTKLAIDRMLKQIAIISRGGDPLWYARGFIVSMTDSIEHLRVASKKVEAALGLNAIPVIPLFEQIESLEKSETILNQMIRDPKHWKGVVELMVGYSDSSKDGGVFPSRLAIATAMNKLDKICEREQVKAIFFQGSGGSVDRGGGNIKDQTAWWPKSALKVYKVTVQGEMVERSLSSPEITRGQLEKISESVDALLNKPQSVPHSPILPKFANAISTAYREMIQKSDFLQIIEKVTPYSDLTELKIGSRPTRRSAQLSVKGLRAIPWVLCWTQTRVLFPTWWGIGTAWKKMNAQDRADLKKAFQEEPVFSSYIRALGFTLAKIELPVWKFYLRKSKLDRQLIFHFETSFEEELNSTLEFMEFINEQKNPLWFQPWLGASIRLRSPMIHPLNLLQILAMEERDFKLFRYTVTGIASGMLTTG